MYINVIRNCIKCYLTMYKFKDKILLDEINVEKL